MGIRVVLADDHTMFREAVAIGLAEDDTVELVGQAADGRQVLKVVADAAPDIVVLDIGMPRLNGIEATHQILRQQPEVRVAILSMSADHDQVVRALKAGACGYILKTGALDELVLALTAIHQGHLYLSPGVLRPIIDGYLEWIQARGPTSLDLLTEREREVLQLAAEGKSNQAIAGILRLGVRTVETHRANLMNKLNLHHVADLVRFAIQHGVIQVEG